MRSIEGGSRIGTISRGPSVTRSPSMRAEKMFIPASRSLPSAGVRKPADFLRLPAYRPPAISSITPEGPVHIKKDFFARTVPFAPSLPIAEKMPMPRGTKSSREQIVSMRKKIAPIQTETVAPKEAKIFISKPREKVSYLKLPEYKIPKQPVPVERKRITQDSIKETKPYILSPSAPTRVDAAAKREAKPKAVPPAIRLEQIRKELQSMVPPKPNVPEITVSRPKEVPTKQPVSLPLRVQLPERKVIQTVPKKELQGVQKPTLAAEQHVRVLPTQRREQQVQAGVQTLSLPERETTALQQTPQKKRENNSTMAVKPQFRQDAKAANAFVQEGLRAWSQVGQGEKWKMRSGTQLANAFAVNPIMTSEIAQKAGIKDGSLSPRMQTLRSAGVILDTHQARTILQKSVHDIPPVASGKVEGVTSKDIRLVLSGRSITPQG